MLAKIFRITRLTLLLILSLSLLLMSCSGNLDRNGYSSDSYELNAYHIKEGFRNAFPDGVSYRLNITGDNAANVENIEVHFHLGVDKRAKYARAELTRNDRTIAADYLDKFGQSAGDLVEYWFVIEDKNGNRTETPKKSFVYLDKSFEWKSIEEDGITVFYYDYYENSLKAAKDVLKVAIGARASLGKTFDVQISHPWRIILYQDSDKLNEAMPRRSDFLSENYQYAGQASPTEGTILIYDYDPIYEPLTKHEVVHMILHEVIKPNGFNMPSWLDEGIADYLSTEENNGYNRVFEDAVKAGRLLPLYSITSQPSTPEDINLLYAQSEQAVAFMVQKYGIEKLPTLVRNLKKAKLDAAFKQTYGIKIDEFERLWHQSLGLTPK